MQAPGINSPLFGARFVAKAANMVKNTSKEDLGVSAGGAVVALVPSVVAVPLKTVGAGLALVSLGSVGAPIAASGALTAANPVTAGVVTTGVGVGLNRVIDGKGEDNSKPSVPEKE
ncbi:MAG: hypothetical protein K2X66_06665 [Cyanobacteria bacterium]|nr:hypothetical protein [Cyanobacteriota bacterium]